MAVLGQFCAMAPAASACGCTQAATTNNTQTHGTTSTQHSSSAPLPGQHIHRNSAGQCCGAHSLRMSLAASCGGACPAACDLGCRVRGPADVNAHLRTEFVFCTRTYKRTHLCIHTRCMFGLREMLHEVCGKLGHYSMKMWSSKGLVC